MPDELRDKTAKYLFSWFADIPHKEWEQLGELERYPWVLHSNNILSLLDSQRCVWTYKNGHRSSGCGKEHPYLLTQFDKYCRYCGRKIEVKDGQG
jgi:hypothetical protein